MLLMLERMGGSEGVGCRVEGDKYRKMIVIQKGSVDGPNALSLSCVIRDTRQDKTVTANAWTHQPRTDHYYGLIHQHN